VALAAVYDPDGERAAELAARFEIPQVCDSVDALLSQRLDIVLVACPNHLHASMTVAALEAGAHVLCEKPMALNTAEAETMLAAMERTGRSLMIGFTNRFRPEVVALQQAVAQGRLGEITAIRCGWLRRAGVPGLGTWFTSTSRAGGGVLTDLGSHMLDLGLWLGDKHDLLTTCCVVDHAIRGGAQASWYTADSQSGGERNVEVSAAGMAVLAGPLNLFVEVSWDCAVPHDQTYLQLIGERGSARLETVFGFSPSGHRPAHPLTIWQSDQQAPELVAGADDLLQPYRDQWRFFVDTVRSGGDLRPWLRASRTTVQVIEAMYASAAQLAATPEGVAPPHRD